MSAPIVAARRASRCDRFGRWAKGQFAVEGSTKYGRIYVICCQDEYCIVLVRNRDNGVSRLPAALAYKLIRRGCSPADLATLAMLWPRGGHVPQQTKAGRAIKPGLPIAVRSQGGQPSSAALSLSACRLKSR